MSNAIEQESALSESVMEQELSNGHDSLSERVRRYVLATSKTLAEVHRVTGIGKSTLNPWLKGERTITTGIFDRICEAYKISPVRLYGGQESNSDVPTLQELSTFNEGEKSKLTTELHQATERALNAEQKMREKIASELERQAEIMRIDWEMEQYKQARPPLAVMQSLVPRKGK